MWIDIKDCYIFLRSLVKKHFCILLATKPKSCSEVCRGGVFTGGVQRYRQYVQ